MEPKENHVRVRYRVDGLLRDVIKVAKNQREAAISRMKIISGMDIIERRRPPCPLQAPSHNGISMICSIPDGNRTGLDRQAIREGRNLL